MSSNHSQTHLELNRATPLSDRLKLKSNQFWNYSLFLFFTLLLLPGVPWWSLTPFLILLFIKVSFNNPSQGLIFLAFIHAFSGLVRWKNPDAPILAGFETILILLFISMIVTRSLILKRFKLPISQNETSIVKILFLTCIFFIGLIVVNILSNWSGLTRSLFMFREYIIPLMLFPFVIAILYKNIDLPKKILSALFISTAIVALVNIFHYLLDLPIGEPRWVMFYDPVSGLSSQVPELRKVAGIPLPRMNHLLGLSGAAAGGVYYMTMSVLGIFLYKNEPKTNLKKYLLLGTGITFIASSLTLSLSAVLSLIFSLIYLYFATFKGNLFIAILKIFSLLFLVSILIVSYGKENNVIIIAYNYIADVWTNLVYPSLTNFDSLLLGDGLGLKSGGAIGVADFLNAKYAQLTDQWLFVVLYQMGLVGFIVVLILLILPLYLVRVIALKGSKDIKFLALAAGIIISGFIGFSHGAALIERLFSMPLIFMTAIILVASKKINKNGPDIV